MCSAWQSDLKANNLADSMTRQGKCYDNAVAQRCFRLLNELHKHYTASLESVSKTRGQSRHVSHHFIAIRTSGYRKKEGRNQQPAEKGRLPFHVIRQALDGLSQRSS